jgi:hypothetical protein
MIEDAYDEAAVARELAALSIAEIVDAAAARGAPEVVRRVAEWVARVPSVRLGRTLARFDARIGVAGIGTAAREVMVAFGATVEVVGSVPADGGVLVVTNHPGAYDSLAMMAAVGRDDVALLASERPFLRAMPHLCDHLVFVTDSRTRGSALGRAAGLRSALAWLRAGKVLVHYGAGAIEPDASFTKVGEEVLGVWSRGTGVLARRAVELGAAVVPAFVRGVHSRRAKALPLVRWAERRGVTTIAPLVQATMPGFGDVRVRVRFGEVMEADWVVGEETGRVREVVAGLGGIRE